MKPIAYHFQDFLIDSHSSMCSLAGAKFHQADQERVCPSSTDYIAVGASLKAITILVFWIIVWPIRPQQLTQVIKMWWAPDSSFEVLIFQRVMNSFGVINLLSCVFAWCRVVWVRNFSPNTNRIFYCKQHRLPIEEINDWSNRNLLTQIVLYFFIFARCLWTSRGLVHNKTRVIFKHEIIFFYQASSTAQQIHE